jgi:hypothetical protein
LNLLNLFFQDTYNTWLKERYSDDLSTHLNLDSDLWLEAGLFVGLDKNQVYGLFNITVEDLRMTSSVSTSDACNWFRALKLQSLRRFYTSEFKLERSILLLIMNDSMVRRPNSANWYWRWDHEWVVCVLLLIRPTI